MSCFSFPIINRSTHTNFVFLKKRLPLVKKVSDEEEDGGFNHKP